MDCSTGEPVLYEGEGAAEGGEWFDTGTSNSHMIHSRTLMRSVVVMTEALGTVRLEPPYVIEMVLEVGSTCVRCATRRFKTQ